MTQRKIIYSEIALTKRKAIKRDIKEKYGQERADKFSENISKALAKLKKFPESGISLRKTYQLDCDYYMLFAEHNYFVYRITDNAILILQVFNEKEDFLYHMFGIVTLSQDTIDYWKE
ncbi:type II toxin-antitoxin system RelE/ParE family toxin [bacterium 1xD8-48]|jgi:plasmid stabilization system protein ParE|nr:type II toxin-antitoxin system RelE/ParE family toxin [Lachnospiraceae bacterium]MCI9328121.1 type II toxin-antitoxin system RelE/ParE family toxin [Lachnospiraceae bacterium]NBJ99640.1 type II toxin-antitoxin system RelE/ParE family toxin [bacterium 1xD8-48]